MSDETTQQPPWREKVDRLIADQKWDAAMLVVERDLSRVLWDEFARMQKLAREQIDVRFQEKRLYEERLNTLCEELDKLKLRVKYLETKKAIQEPEKNPGAPARPQSRWWSR